MIAEAGRVAEVTLLWLLGGGCVLLVVVEGARAWRERPVVVRDEDGFWSDPRRTRVHGR